MISNCIFLRFEVATLAQRLEIYAPRGVLNSLRVTLSSESASRFGSGSVTMMLLLSAGWCRTRLHHPEAELRKRQLHFRESGLFSHDVACGCLFAIWSFLVVTLVAKTAIALTSGSVLGKPSMMRVSSGSLMASSTFFHCFDAM